MNSGNRSFNYYIRNDYIQTPNWFCPRINVEAGLHLYYTIDIRFVEFTIVSLSIAKIKLLLVSGVTSNGPRYMGWSVVAKIWITIYNNGRGTSPISSGGRFACASQSASVVQPRQLNAGGLPRVADNGTFLSKWL